MTRILVLGTSGMLGSMVLDRLQRNPDFDVRGTVRYPDRAPANAVGPLHLDVAVDAPRQIEAVLERFPADLIVNCIGLINRYCRDDDPEGVREAVTINALFPHLLNSTLARLGVTTRVIHATTDCVFSGRDGGYDEEALHDPIDFYGKSKSLGEVLSPRWLNIRSSIIGPEPRTHGSLLDWFLSHTPGTEVAGYTHHLWNGVTTLQYAQLCEGLANGRAFESARALGPTIHYCPNRAVTKHELLVMVNEVYDRKVAVHPVSGPSPKVDRRLSSRLLLLDAQPMREAIEELKSYCDAVGFAAAQS